MRNHHMYEASITGKPGALWRTSSYSSGGQCVAVAALHSGIGVRDTKRPYSPALRYNAAGWDAFRKAL